MNPHEQIDYLNYPFQKDDHQQTLFCNCLKWKLRGQVEDFEMAACGTNFNAFTILHFVDSMRKAIEYFVWTHESII